jgi:hypothetical protein
MLQTFTFRVSTYDRLRAKANDLIEHCGMSKTLYGSEPLVGEVYRGIYFKRPYDWNDPQKETWRTSPVEMIWPIERTVGMEAAGGHIVARWLIRTHSGTL